MTRPDPSTWPEEGVPLHFPVETGCFGCSQHNPQGMQLEFERRGDRIVGGYVTPIQFAGGPRLVHGGILAVLLDEYSCAAAFHLGGLAVVTGSLHVRYEQPAPIETELRMSAGLLSMEHPRYWMIECDIHIGDTRIARSEGRFFPLESIQPGAGG